MYDYDITEGGGTDVVNKKLKVAIIASGTVIALASGLIMFMTYGALDYTNRCAHIKEKQGIVCDVGDTLSIDDLAYFSNYDERRITGITGGEGEISEDGSSITITKADGFATVYVHAHNKNAPEHTEHGITVMIKST